MNTAGPAPCRLLDWDTEFFQFRIARVQGDALTDEQALRIDEWNRTNHIRCVCFLARSDDPATVRAAENDGFGLVDIRVTFERGVRPPARLGRSIEAAAAGIRPVRDTDLSKLQALARTAHTNTRFFRDVLFPRKSVEALYSTWIGLECQGRAQQVFVSVSSTDEPLGYISCHFDPERREGRIGLVGVNSMVHRKGIGKSLVLAAFDWLAGQGAQTVSVVTQGNNGPALRLYERCGFFTRELQLWYHKWYPESDGNNA